MNHFQELCEEHSGRKRSLECLEGSTGISHEARKARIPYDMGIMSHDMHMEQQQQQHQQQSQSTMLHHHQMHPHHQQPVMIHQQHQHQDQHHQHQMMQQHDPQHYEQQHHLMHHPQEVNAYATTHDDYLNILIEQQSIEMRSYYEHSPWFQGLDTQGKIQYILDSYGDDGNKRNGLISVDHDPLAAKPLDSSMMHQNMIMVGNSNSQMIGSVASSSGQPSLGQHCSIMPREQHIPILAEEGGDPHQLHHHHLSHHHHHHHLHHQQQQHLSLGLSNMSPGMIAAPSIAISSGDGLVGSMCAADISNKNSSLNIGLDSAHSGDISNDGQVAASAPSNSEMIARRTPSQAARDLALRVGLSPFLNLNKGAVDRQRLLEDLGPGVDEKGVIKQVKQSWRRQRGRILHKVRAVGENADRDGQDGKLFQSELVKNACRTLFEGRGGVVWNRPTVTMLTLAWHRLLGRTFHLKNVRKTFQEVLNAILEAKKDNIDLVPEWLLDVTEKNTTWEQFRSSESASMAESSEN